LNLMNDWKTKDILDYFSHKANDYDSVEQQPYWVLSDCLLWYSLELLVLSKLEKFCFLDAGGGTGRWSKKILDNYKDSEGAIYDISVDMLDVAKKRMSGSLEKRISLYNGNIENMKALEKETFDLTICFHNVLGFVDSPTKALMEIVRVTKINGYVVSFVPNIYHSIYFNILAGNLSTAKFTAETQEGKFTREMPYIHMFSPASISKLYLEAGLSNVYTIGFPIFIYPGIEETRICGSSEHIAALLNQKDNFDMIFNIERGMIYNPEIAARGNNLFVIGVKSE
jgi:ubiquinone/menaquinone biosynthesis C-methylase UbiE